MRPPFTDVTRLRTEAEMAIESGNATVRRWWTNKYKLPSNHSLFLDRPEAVHMREMTEDLISRRNELEAELDEGTAGDSKRALETLNAIKKALGEEDHDYDPIVEQWEKDMDEGRVPDLDAR